MKLWTKKGYRPIDKFENAHVLRFFHFLADLMAVVLATSRHFQRNDMMIAYFSQEIEGVTMQLLSLKTTSGKREGGFMEYFDKDNLTLRHVWR